MILTERGTGRRYQLVKRFVKVGQSARFQEAGSGRRYNLLKVYV